MSPRPLATPDEICTWSADPSAAARFSPFSPRPFLLVEDGRLPAERRQDVTAWLRQLACPSLCIAQPGAASELARACDAVLATAADAEPLLANIERSPIAASVLVDVLRTTETLALADALRVESLAYATLQAGPEFRRWLESERRADAPRVPDAGPAVLLEREGDALRLELNRPSQRNAMSVEMRDALVEALQLVLVDASIRRVQISGRGKCFSTGGDLSEFGTAPDPASAHIVRSLSVPGRFLAQCADRVEVRLHGACIGSGIEFPTFAGRVVASPDAYFQLPELRFGLIPGAGGCISIARRIGRRRTAWLALSGKRINAQTALEWGLVDAVLC